jgi:hypothetical protein
MRSLVCATLLAMLAACVTPVRPERPLPPIPADQIPDGFEAKDCYWEIVPPEPHKADDVRIGGIVRAMRSANDSDPEPQRVVHCHRSEEHSTRKCMGSDGQEKPISACEAAKP